MVNDARLCHRETKSCERPITAAPFVCNVHDLGHEQRVQDWSGTRCLLESPRPSPS